MATRLAPPPTRLSPRQMEALQRVSEDVPIKTVARQMGISTETLYNHLRAAYAKLGVSSAAAAVGLLFRRGDLH